MNPYEPPKDALRLEKKRLEDRQQSLGESMAWEFVSLLAAGMTALLILIVTWLVMW